MPALSRFLVGRGTREFVIDAVAKVDNGRNSSQFNTLRALAMALTGEVGELAEIFPWLSAEESAAVMSSPRTRDVRDELADVLMNLVRRADVLDVDLIGAGQWKDHITNEDLHIFY